MRGFGRVFWLEMTSLVRSKTLAMLTVVSLAWMSAVPRFVAGDGTLAGTRELWIRYSLGGVFVLLVVALLASATGSLARERTTKRLALTAVRPVPHFAIALARICALTASGAFVLALSCAALALAPGNALTRPCRHAIDPVLPPVREEAKAMYAAYMKDPRTPESVRRARPSSVIRLLENRAVDHYSAVRTNEVACWKFPVPSVDEGLSVRARFAGQFDSRRDVSGVFRLDGREGAVSNVTQAILEIPLRKRRDGRRSPGEDGSIRVLSFENRGRETVLLRPRRDLQLLVPADSFLENLLRTYLELVSILALTVAFGIFLSSALSRPVALFVALSVLAVGEMSSGLVECQAESLDAGWGDRAGFVLTRTVSDILRPVTALDPISRLADDTCVETREVGRTLALDFLILPLLFSFLSGFAVSRKGS